jgi:hypothetical protein
MSLSFKVYSPLFRSISRSILRVFDRYISHELIRRLTTSLIL